MSEENPSDSEKKVDTDYPDLWTVRNYKVGVFYEKREFKGFHLRKEEKEPRPIKSLTHPLWLKDGISGQVQIEKSILEILRADGTKATRHKGKRTKWKTALENNGKKGYHVSHVRTPKGYKWVNSKIAKEGYNKIAGRKESGLAYKIRREFWRILSRNDNAAILLADDCAWIKKKKERKTEPVSVPLVNLSRAVQEMLSESLFDNEGKVHKENEEFVKKWYRKLRSSFVPDLSDDQIVHYVNKNQNDFIRIIAKKRWKAILAHLSEIEISNRTASKKSNNVDEFEYAVGESISNSQLEPDGVYDLFFDDPEMLGAFFAHLNDPTGEYYGIMEDIDSVCKECGGQFKLQSRLVNLEVVCNVCGLVSRKIDMSEEEHFFSTITSLDG
tara:strand:+ start:898 stop:2052 length:1155 start_codon:yes stop_codon:yes gene_type:complete